MPAYNSAKTLKTTINSVQNQSYKDWELIIIDDASQDETISIAEEYAEADPRILVLNNKQNQGVAKTRNLGLEAKSGTNVAFLDSDDIWLQDKLKIQIEACKKNNIYFSYMSYDIINYNGKYINSYMPPLTVNHKRLLYGNPIGMLTTLIDSNFLGNSKFPIRGHEDYALWLSLLRKGGSAVRVGDKKPYAQYRTHSQSVSYSKIKAIQWQWSIYRECEFMSPLKASIFMLPYAFNSIAKRI